MRLIRPMLRAGLLLAGILTLTLPAPAQSTTGTIYGAVADPTGASIPGAQVTITDVHTGVKQTTKTNGTGEYTFTTVNPGDFSATAASAGFKTETQTDVTVAANQNVHVVFSLTTGAVAESIEVKAGVTLVDTREAQIGDTIDQQKIQDLPTSDRNTYNLLQTVTGVVAYNGDSNIGSRNGTTFSVNGFPAASPSFYLDGAYNNAFKGNGGNKPPNPDALQEFRVITSNFDAEFGRSPGGVVNIITRSGTEHYHGSAYEYLRNDTFNARNYFVLPGPNLPFKQNQYGATFGGPVPLLPKTFFFLSYEHFQLHTVAIVSPTSIVTPTAAERKGDFSMSKPGIKPTKLPAGTNCGTAAAPIICPAALDPVAQNLLKFVPVYDSASGTTLQQTANGDSSDNQGLARLDYNGFNHHAIEAMFFNTVGSNVAPNAGGNQIIGVPGLLSPYSGMLNYENQMNIVAADNWTVSDRTVNSIHAFYTQNRYIIGNQIPGHFLADLGSQAPEGGPIFAPAQFTISGDFTEGPSGAGPSDINQLSFGLIDTATLNRGHHSLKIGGSFDSNKYSEDGNANAEASFTFTGATSGTAMADFLLGKANVLNQTSSVLHRTRNQDPAAYVQDDWQVTKTLNLNLGVRWEIFAPWTGDGTEGTFKAGAQSNVIPNAPIGLQYVGDPGVPDGIFHTSYTRFAPRVGLAYDVYGDGRTSLRAGYGIFYNSHTEDDIGGLVQTPYSLSVKTNTVPNLVCPYGGKPPACPAGTPAGASPFPFVFSRTNSTFTSGAAISSVPPNNGTTPYANEFNVSIEQQLSSGTALRVSYVGSTYMKQLISLDVNAPVFVPNAPITTASINARRPYQPYGTCATCFEFAAINQSTPANNQSYNSLQVNLRGRIKQLNFNASYVWAKALNYTGPTVDNTDIRKNRGAADIDLRNRFVFSGLYHLPAVHAFGLFGREILSGWQLNDITIIQSGSPFTVTSGVDTNRDGTNNDRPNIIGDPYTHASSRAAKIKQFLNPAAFSTPSFTNPGDNPYGNEQRNSLYGPMNINTNLSVFKEFALYRQVRFQFRAEAYNALNNVNLNNPRTNLTVFPTAAQAITGAADPRHLQFAAKLLF